MGPRKAVAEVTCRECAESGVRLLWVAGVIPIPLVASSRWSVVQDGRLGVLVSGASGARGGGGWGFCWIELDGRVERERGGGDFGDMGVWVFFSFEGRGYTRWTMGGSRVDRWSIGQFGEMVFSSKSADAFGWLGRSFARWMGGSVVRGCGGARWCL